MASAIRVYWTEVKILRNKVIYRIPSRVRQVMNYSKTVSILFRTKTKWWNVKFFKRWGQKGPSKPASQNFLANIFLYYIWFSYCWTQVFAIWITFKFFTINCKTIIKYFTSTLSYPFKYFSKISTFTGVGNLAAKTWGRSLVSDCRPWQTLISMWYLKSWDGLSVSTWGT